MPFLLHHIPPAVLLRHLPHARLLSLRLRLSVLLHHRGPLTRLVRLPLPGPRLRILDRHPLNVLMLLWLDHLHITLIPIVRKLIGMMDNTLISDLGHVRLDLWWVGRPLLLLHRGHLLWTHLAGLTLLLLLHHHLLHLLLLLGIHLVELGLLHLLHLSVAHHLLLLGTHLHAWLAHLWVHLTGLSGLLLALKLGHLLLRRWLTLGNGRAVISNLLHLVLQLVAKILGVLVLRMLRGVGRARSCLLRCTNLLLLSLL